MATALSDGTRPGLVLELVLRDLRVRYRRSVLGVLWAQVAPLAQVVVLTVIFTRVVPLGIDDYPAFALLGLLPWLWFQSALSTAALSVVHAPDLVAQPAFPRPVLPMAAVASTLAHHLLALPLVLIATVVATGRLPLSALALVPLVAVQALLAAGPAHLLAGLHVRLRDTAQVLAVGLVPVFYATPVFYDVDALDAAPILHLNPLVPIIDGYRSALLEGRWPAALPLLAVALAGLVVLVIGRAVYRARMGSFLEEL
jgi:lipopolysaccharide transport system permease protein